jgi:hypothetical protein
VMEDRFTLRSAVRAVPAGACGVVGAVTGPTCSRDAAASSYPGNCGEGVGVCSAAGDGRPEAGWSGRARRSAFHPRSHRENHRKCGEMEQIVGSKEVYSEGWWAEHNNENRCVAHRKNRNQCHLPARRGGTVCRFHGGAAPQVKAKARERLELAADRMARELLRIATGAESESVKLAAVKDALDRGGVPAKTEVAVEVKQPEPWEEMMMDFARTSRQRHEALEQAARRREPLPAVVVRELEVVDAEVVPPPEGHAYRPSAAVDGADRPKTADVPTAKSAPSTAPVPPPPRSLNQEEAAALMRESRLRSGAVRRNGRKRPVRRRQWG